MAFEMRTKNADLMGNKMVLHDFFACFLNKKALNYVGVDLYNKNDVDVFITAYSHEKQ